MRGNLSCRWNAAKYFLIPSSLSTYLSIKIYIYHQHTKAVKLFIQMEPGNKNRDDLDWYEMTEKSILLHLYALKYVRRWINALQNLCFHIRATSTVSYFCFPKLLFGKKSQKMTSNGCQLSSQKKKNCQAIYCRVNFLSVAMLMVQIWG